MHSKSLPIASLVFLAVAMAVQFVVSYRHEQRELVNNIEYKMELAQKDFIFEVYDMHEATDDINHFFMEFVDEPDEQYALLKTVLSRFPDLYSCFVCILPEYAPVKGKIYAPGAYRPHNQDTILAFDFADIVDIPARDWYTGTLQSDDDEDGYWSLPYKDFDYGDPVFTYSQKIYDDEGRLIGIAGADYTLTLMKQLLKDIRPYEDAVCRLLSTDGSLIVEIGSGEMKDMIIKEKILSPTDMRLVIGVPKRHIRIDITRTSLITLAVLLFGFLTLGFLLLHIRREREAYTRVETTNKLMEKELQIASHIQAGILRHDFPNDGQVSLDAEIIPAREVGGDLYDFYHDGNDLLLLIGDVSGKGIPAAMFMASTVNLFRSAARHLSSPKQIMEEMNAVLSENNPTMMFVTAFVGRLHLSTGQFVYSNAGHCEPIVVGNQQTVCLPVEPNIPLGYDGKYKFSEQGTMLGQGDTLVLYTDGITEARNQQHEMLGRDRWYKIAGGKSNLLKEVKMFIGIAEQADDITLMTICKTSEVHSVCLRVDNMIDHWPILRNAINEYGLCVGMEQRTLKKTTLAIEEAVVNIVNYSQAEWIELRVERQMTDVPKGKSMMKIILSDNGVAFDPTQQTYVNIDQAAAERQIGGMGIALLRRIADELQYRRTDEQNELTIIKYI